MARSRILTPCLLLFLIALGQVQASYDGHHIVEVRQRFWSPVASSANASTSDGEDTTIFPPLIRIATPLTVDKLAQHASLATSMANAWGVYFNRLIDTAGGVFINGTQYGVELIILDDHYDQEAVSWLTQYLIEVENVTLFLGPYSSGMTGVMAALVQEAGGVMIAPASSNRAVFEGRSNVFGTLSGSTTFFDEVFEIFDALGDEVRSVLVLSEDLGWSAGTCSIVQVLSQSRGINATASPWLIPSEPESEDLVDIVAKMAALNPDVVLSCGYFNYCQSLLKQMYAQQYTPKAIVTTICVTEPDYFSYLGKPGLGVMGVTPWIGTSQRTGPITGNLSSIGFAELYRNQFLENPPYQAASAYVAAATLVHALETANSLDPNAVADVLRAMDGESFLGAIRFDESGLRDAPMMIVQTTQTQLSVVGSDYTEGTAPSGMVFPRESWTDMQCLIYDKTSANNYGLTNGECSQCELGKSSAIVNTSEGHTRVCEPCDAGRSGVDDGDTISCVPCAPGTYSSEEASTACLVCRAGTFRNRSYGSYCDVCPVGTISAEHGSSACATCAAGKWVNSTGQSECDDCPLGMYRDNDMGSDACMACSYGTVASEVGATACSVCQAGYFASKEHDECQTCEIGSYSSAGLEACDLCPDGTFTAERGATAVSSCNQCADGFYLQNYSCQKCPFGQTTSNPSDEVCELLPELKFSVVIVLATGVLSVVAVKLSRRAYKRRLQLFEARAESLMEEQIRLGLGTTTQFGHPMVLIRAARFLNLSYEELLTLHEGSRDNHRLIFVDSVKRFQELHDEGFRTIFLSYQWLSWSRKGANQLQFGAMKSSVQQVIEKRNWSAGRVYVWIDVLSIPQAHKAVQNLAIHSLFTYAKCSDALVCICPTSRHEDTNEVANAQTFERRLWCRMEVLARCCSNGVKGVYVCDDSGLRAVTREWAKSVVRVFDGELTCCRRGHNDGTEPCDRTILVLTLLGLYFECYACTYSTSGVEFFREMILPQKEAIFPKEYDYVGKGGRLERRELFGDLIARIDSKIRAGELSCDLTYRISRRMSPTIRTEGIIEVPEGGPDKDITPMVSTHSGFFEAASADNTAEKASPTREEYSQDNNSQVAL